MNAIFKEAFEQVEKLPPEAQKALALELEQRAYDLWLEAEVQKGIDSLDQGEEIPAEQVFSELRARLKEKYGV